jgi:hypothetical protein
MVQEYKPEDVGERIVENTELEKVLFDVVYPLFGFRKTGAIAGRGGSKGSEEELSCLVQ